MTNAVNTPWHRFFSHIRDDLKDLAHLLRLDFFRALKDKSNLIISAIVGGYALFFILLSYLITAAVNTPGFDLFTSRGLLSISMQISSMPFIIIVVMVCIFIGKDLTYGTIRNKIIAGYSKKQIYVATLLMSWLMAVILLLVFQAILFVVGAPILTFPVGGTNPPLSDFFIRLGMGYFLVTFAMSIVVFLVMVPRNMIVGLIISLVLFVTGPIFSFYISSFLELQWGTHSLVFEIFECFYFYQAFTILSGGSLTGAGISTALDSQLVLKALISTGASIVLLNWLGVYLFHKLDLK
jgi:ABC-2 type transport system permease protein